MSAAEAWTSATTVALAASFSFNSAPSRALTIYGVLPTTFSIVPRMRTGASWAQAEGPPSTNPKHCRE